MDLVHAHDAAIPALGFGTWDLRGDVARAMVGTAIEIGYRHFDTAQMYGNEAEVGAAIRACGLPREEFFVTTKIWPDQFRAADFDMAVAQSLDRLKLGWIDLLLLHWPSSTVPLAETLDVLDDVKERGIAKFVGVSNFTIRLLEEATRLARAPIVVNQVEYHPFLGQNRLLATMRGYGMALTAYLPIARGRVIGNPVIEAIAQRHGKDPAQVSLRWLVQQDGVIAIPRTSNPARARSNFSVFDFALSDAEMAEISALAAPDGRMVNDPTRAPEWDPS